MKNDIVCFSHLRWNFVYQRPQHLISRFAKESRVFFIEEPIFDADNDSIELRTDEHSAVQSVVPHLQRNLSEAEVNKRMRNLVNMILNTMDVKNFIAWYYSPMALMYSDHLKPSLVVYDCMDELSGFRFAHPELVNMEKMLFKKADIVFTGGRNLFNAKKTLHNNIHAFPSSIDKKHFLKARKIRKDPADQLNIPHPRFGFYGVVDERFDIALLGELAGKRPDWHFIILGPIVKIDPAVLPRLDNIHYLGGKTYLELPAYLAGWDVAIMPFALNDSTKYISPTKTPEYLCGGKPVISTPIVDVVNDYGRHGVVEIAGNADGFIASGEQLLKKENYRAWLKTVDAHLKSNSWDNTWQNMTALMEATMKARHASELLRTPERVATLPFENTLTVINVSSHV